MNEEFQWFIEKHNIDIENIYDDLQIYNEKEINRLIADYKIEGPTKIEEVSIADIIGYDYSWKELTNNAAKNFSGFFSHQDSYHSRSLGMLTYSSEEIIEKLRYSFTSEPIKVFELDDERKVISVNGLHRYALLRIHYINELKKAKGNIEKEKQLRQKYTIPVSVTKVDLLKTYCHFLIDSVNTDRVYLSNHFDENYNKTGNVKVCLEDKKIVMNDEELIVYTKKLLKGMVQSRVSWFLDDINYYSEKYSSFKKIIETYFVEEIALLTDNTNKKGRG